MEKEYYYNSYKEIEAFVLDKIREVGVPNNHPFLDYPNTPESMGIKLIILIYLYTGNAELVTSLIKKAWWYKTESFHISAIIKELMKRFGLIIYFQVCLR